MRIVRDLYLQQTRLKLQLNVIYGCLPLNHRCI
jgi:hypothetical protein